MTNYNTSVADYISQLGNGGIASPNKYWVDFTLPPGIKGDNWGSMNSQSMVGSISESNTHYNKAGGLSMRCIQMQFPSRALMTTESRHWGTPYKIPYSVMYDAVTFTFVSSRDLAERKFFEIWQETVVNIGSNSLNFYDEYVRPIKLYQLDSEGEVTYEVELQEAYPINIGQIDYSYATINDFQAIPVTFTYRHWKNKAFAE